jgi:hypothetical protein
VELSSIVAKDSLINDLNEFVINAKKTSRKLQRFSSRIGGAVEEIVSINEQVAMLLEDTIKNTQLPNGPIQSVMSVFSAIKPAGPEFIVGRQKELEQVWNRAIRLLESTITELIHEAESNVAALERLEGQLDGIYRIVLMEDKNIDTQSEAVVCHLDELGCIGLTSSAKHFQSNSLWTKLGSSRNKGKPNIGKIRWRLRAFTSIKLVVVLGSASGVD